MPVFAEDPSHLSKARLKSYLIAHNVALPPAKSKKKVYVELYTRHVEPNNAADFSSDEEPEHDVDEEKTEDTKMVDPRSLTDDDLRAALLKHGVKAGPIVASTRALYEKKLRNIFLLNGHDTVNGVDEAFLYSDSEKEKNEEPDTKDLITAPKPADQSQQENRQVEFSSQGGYVYHQCFLVSSRLEPVQETFKDFLDKDTTPTGIYATRRRPIKGAAGRPVQYKYPDTPVSPTTLERREVERRLVPVQVQILVFLIVTLILYLIYVCVEDNSFSPLLALLDGQNMGLDIDDPNKQD